MAVALLRMAPEVCHPLVGSLIRAPRADYFQSSMYGTHVVLQLSVCGELKMTNPALHCSGYLELIKFAVMGKSVIRLNRLIF